MTKLAVIHLKLDDFIVEFLKGAFPQAKNFPYFQFPKSHDLEGAIQILAKGVDEPVSEEGLAIQFSVPLWKSDFEYFTLTKSSVQLLRKRIKTLYGVVTHDFLAKKRNEGYEIKDCILLFMAKYEISETDTNYERVKKDFDRWRNRQAVKKYRKNARKKIAVCPAV